MSAVQLFNFIRHRYTDMRAYFNKDTDMLVLSVYEGMDEEIGHIKELAVRKGLYCSEVNASWPEYLDSDILSCELTSDFLVITDIRGKYMQPGPC